MSAYSSVTKTLRKVKDRKLTVRELHAADPSYELAIYSSAVHTMQQPDGPLVRQNRNGDGPYEYGLKENFNVDTWVREKEGRILGPRDPAKKPSAVHVIHTVADRRDSAAAPAFVQKPQSVNQTMERKPEEPKSTPAPVAAAKPVEKEEVLPAASAPAESHSLARQHTFSMPIPGKASVFISIPAGFDEADFELLTMMLGAYLERMRAQEAKALPA